MCLQSAICTALSQPVNPKYCRAIIFTDHSCSDCNIRLETIYCSSNKMQNVECANRLCNALLQFNKSFCAFVA